MVEDTLELGGVQVIAAPPVTGGHSPITQLTLSLAGESDPAPPVLTAVLQPEEINISRLSLVQLLHYGVLIGPEFYSDEIFSCQLSYVIKYQLKASLAGSEWHKDS